MTSHDDRIDALESSLEASGLPTLNAWRQANPESTASMVLHTETTLELAVYHTALFWPDLVEHEGGVFLRDGFGLRAHGAWCDQGLDTTAIERVMNHRHIEQMLPGDYVGYRNCLHLGRVLRETWAARLRACFPTYSFSVDMRCDDDNEEVVVTFWCNRMSV